MSSDNAQSDRDEPLEGELIDRQSYEISKISNDVDIQVSTARAYPRSIKAFQKKALSYATLDVETAESCFYVLTRQDNQKGGKGGKGSEKAIKGPSVRLAEIVAAAWGNVKFQATVIDIGQKFVTARGSCWDLENNVMVSIDVQRRITNKYGVRYKDDMIGVTANAACSIALRNAIFKAVPMAMVKPIYDAARKTAVGDQKTLTERRTRMVDQFKKMGVNLEQVLSKVSKPSLEDFDLDDLEQMIGLFTALRDGETTIEDAFPHDDESKPVEHASKSEALAAKFANGGNGHSTEEKEPVAKKEAATNETKTVDAEIVKPETETTAAKGKKVAKESTAKISKMAECLAYLRSVNLESVEANPEGTWVEFVLADGKRLILTEELPKILRDGIWFVDVTEDDAPLQTKYIVEQAIKKAKKPE